MKREIKFRAWDDDRNRMFEWKEIRKEFDQWCNVSDSILMQYTGLKDKNGKEIYEGDILINDSLGKSHKFILKYHYGTYRLKSTLIHGHRLMIETNYNFFEVIGNIYENPELLK